MKKYVNGHYVEMTTEETAKLAAETAAETPPTLEERLAALETAQQRLLAKLSAFLSV